MDFIVRGVPSSLLSLQNFLHFRHLLAVTSACLMVQNIVLARSQEDVLPQRYNFDLPLSLLILTVSLPWGDDTNTDF